MGDRLRDASGRDVAVEGVRYTVGRAVVYTLTVGTDHTFFVGAARVLVHNANGPCSLQFGPGELDAHFLKHNNEWVAISKDAYLKRAQSLLNQPLDANLVQVLRPNGDVLRYRVSSNEFVAADAQGRIKTLFRPKQSGTYWTSQGGPL